MALLSAEVAQGSVLIFEKTGPTGQFTLGELIPQTYGDNITTSPDSNFFLYGSAGGITPNITASYFGTVRHWGTGYGDMSEVAYGNDGTGIFGVELTAAAGFEVQLSEFHLAVFPDTDFDIKSVVVRDAANNVLFSGSNHIEGDLIGPRHTTYLPAVQSQFLRIEIDASNLTGRDIIGLDNVTFSQVNVSAAVPEPATLTLWSLGALGCAIAGHRRRRRA